MYGMPQILHLSVEDAHRRPTMQNVLAETTMTGEQRAMMDGLIRETHGRPHAPGLPPGGNKMELHKVTPSKTKSAMGMTKIRGTKY